MPWNCVYCLAARHAALRMIATTLCVNYTFSQHFFSLTYSVSSLPPLFNSYFVFAVDSSESELGILDLIQVFVESLDQRFENVCELDLIFHVEKVHHIIDEICMGGMVLETNMVEILKHVDNKTLIMKKEVSIVRYRLLLFFFLLLFFPRFRRACVLCCAALLFFFFFLITFFFSFRENRKRNIYLRTF